MSTLDTLMSASFLSAPEIQRKRLNVVGDGLNVTDHGVKNDGRKGWYFLTWANNTNSVSIYSLKPSTGVTVGTTTYNGKTYGVISWTGSDVGRNFQPQNVGLPVAVQGITWGGKATTTIARYVSSNSVYTTDLPDQTITNQGNTQLVWPAMVAGDVGKSIWIDRASGGWAGGSGFVYNRGSGIGPRVTTIASVPSPFSFTTAANLGSTSNNGFAGAIGSADASPTLVEWGTDNSSSLFACGPLAVARGLSFLYFPAGHYCAFGMAPTFGSTTDVPGSVETLSMCHWFGDGATGIFTDVSGAPILKKIVPRSAPPMPAPWNDSIAAALPRLKSVSNPVVISWGDSMGMAAPDLPGQGFAEAPDLARMETLSRRNPSKNFTFIDRSIAGSTFYAADGIPGAFEDWYTNHALPWEIYCKTVTVGPGGSTSSVTPDVVMLTQSGANDTWAISPRIVKAVMNKIKAWPQINGLPPDIIMVNARPTQPLRTSGSSRFPDYVQFFYPPERSAMLLRSIAKKAGIPFLDYHAQSKQAQYGYDETRTSMQRIPDHAARAVQVSQPYTLNMLCRHFKATLVLIGANGAAVWGAAGSQSIIIKLGARSDNVLILSRDDNGYLTYQVNTWGYYTTGTVTHALGSQALLVAAGSNVAQSGGVASSGPMTVGDDANMGLFSSSPAIGSVIYLPGGQYGSVDGGAFRSQVTDFFNGNAALTADYSGFSGVIGAFTAVVGGLPFVPSDADAQVDIVVGSNAPNKVTGYTDINNVTLRDAATVGYTAAAATPLFLGGICVPKTSTNIQVASDAGANPQIEVDITGTFLQVGYKRAGDTRFTRVFAGHIERMGGPFYPRISVTGSSLTIQPVSLHMEKTVFHQPTLLPMDAWGDPAAGLVYEEGGNGYVHSSFRQLLEVDMPVLNAQNLAAV